MITLDEYIENYYKYEDKFLKAFSKAIKKEELTQEDIEFLSLNRQMCETARALL